MLTALTLICNPAAPLLSEERVGDVLLWLDAQECGAVSRRTLAPGVADDLTFSLAEERHAGLRAGLRDYLAGAPIDIVLQPAERRRKRLLIADMDSTIIRQECIDELADFAGKRAEISAITERAMRGELDFESALLERVAMLKGLPEAALQEVFDRRISLNPGARTLVATMKKLGATTALVSGGFSFFTSRVAAAAGFDTHQANRLLIENGRLSGDVARPILGRSAKDAALVRLAGEGKIPLEQTLAAGDGANDLSMLGRAGLGVAFRAKPKVAAAADARIDHGDLTALLYLQGVPQTEFIAS
jgi:phosphoserine phosphatase